MTNQILTAILHKEEDLYVAECPEVGTVSQGHSVEEAVANLKEATELYLEEFSLPEVDLQDELQWEALYEKTQPQLVAAARRAKQEIAEGLAKPMD